MTEPVIYEIGGPGRCAAILPDSQVDEAKLPVGLLRTDLPLPEVSELDLVRHYVRLSQMNHAVDTGFYPLGSCTMKYNPKVNEAAAQLPGFTETHPYQDEATVQGNLQLMFELQEWLKAITGFDGVSLQPAAGAQGELTGMLMIRAYHLSRGDTKRVKVLIPDSAHGTNPASTTMCGYTAVQIKSDARGNVDLSDLRAHCDDTVAGLMLTNPNTLGLFDEHVLEITEAVHACGGLVYGDGANLNAIVGVVHPAALGFDVMHLNLHKTFATPHGGGGPGAGPVACTEALADFLPAPIVAEGIWGCGCGDAECDGECECEDDECDGECECEDDECDGECECEDESDDESEDDDLFDDSIEEPTYSLVAPAQSIGRMKSFYGNFGVLVRAYAYIRTLGAAGLRQVAEDAVLAANYMRVKLQDVYPLPYRRVCMHEFVIEGRVEGVEGIHNLDIAKRLMDYGYHPPTMSFPLIVHDALMIEPTETESVETMDGFVDAMIRIAGEARENPTLLREAPHNAPVTRLDEVKAARDQILRWRA